MCVPIVQFAQYMPARAEDACCLCAVAAIQFGFTGLSISPCAIPITPIGVGIFPQGININPIGAYITPIGVNVQPQVFHLCVLLAA